MKNIGTNKLSKNNANKNKSNAVNVNNKPNSIANNEKINNLPSFISQLARITNGKIKVVNRIKNNEISSTPKSM